MNPDFSDLQTLWQQQPPQAPDLTSWMAGARRLEAKWKRSQWTAGICLGLTILFFLYMLIDSPMETPAGWSGMLLLILSMMVALGFILNRSTRATESLDLPVTEFANHHLKAIRRRLMITRQVIPWYMLAILLGVNLTYLEVLSRGDLTFRLTAHLVVSAIMIFGGWMLYRRQRARLEHEAEPVIQALESLTGGQ
ncbi:MAG: hypothetical protein HUU10_13280 [Bacteroidetes bacterium]|nr:hypothetical protein [Bacteroidota bacterium]